MEARMRNIAMIVPEAMQALLALGASAEKGSVPSRALGLVHFRASRINGCSTRGSLRACAFALTWPLAR
jgi:hypothetical protein